MRMNIALSRRTLQAALNSLANALKSPALSTAAI
jgi:bifunctional pyridoxal-dependent enzyme with beta-cystathionase and maltose regulon repressor activities